MQNAMLKMGQELNREILEELSQLENEYTEEKYKALRKELNQDRIKALGLTLIQGGKSE